MSYKGSKLNKKYLKKNKKNSRQPENYAVSGCLTKKNSTNKTKIQL